MFASRTGAPAMYRAGTTMAPGTPIAYVITGEVRLEYGPGGQSVAHARARRSSLHTKRVKFIESSNPADVEQTLRRYFGWAKVRW